MGWFGDGGGGEAATAASKRWVQRKGQSSDNSQSCDTCVRLVAAEDEASLRPRIRAAAARVGAPLLFTDGPLPIIVVPWPLRVVPQLHPGVALVLVQVPRAAGAVGRVRVREDQGAEGEGLHD